MIFEEIEDWRTYVKLPNLEAIDWKKQAEINTHTNFQAFVMGAGIVPFKDGSSIYDTNKLKVCIILNGPFERLHSYMGVDVINFHDDYGAADRMFMRPELWRQIIKPHLKRVVDACHELGLIYQH